MTEGTVYFPAPDTNVAYGGNRQIYRVVDALTAAGIAASVVHSTHAISIRLVSERYDRAVRR